MTHSFCFIYLLFSPFFFKKKDDNNPSNKIFTLMIGSNVVKNQVLDNKIVHASILQLILRMHRLPQIGASGNVRSVPENAFVSSYQLPPIAPSSGSSKPPSKHTGTNGVVVFVILVFSLAGILLAGFFSVFFYRRRKEAKLEGIGAPDGTHAIALK